MPGTIMVSVLEFLDLPLSSSTSIKASMGKIEYQVIDKGNFTFPLTSLRDDLILKIQDNEGNEISRSGIHIRLILEKGVWEDVFPIGGGHLHLKLQVILSDEARDRIRIMRQSALKKKHDELLRSSGREAESDSSTIIGNAELPFKTSNEVSESQKQDLQLEAVSPLQTSDNESSTRNIVEAQLEQQQLNPKIADQYKETSSTKLVSKQVPNLIQLQHKGKEPVNHSPSEKDSQTVTGSKEMVVFLGSKKTNARTDNPIKHNHEGDDDLQYSEKRPPRRIPSNVRNMISAFESGLAQDMRPHVKPPPTQYEATTIENKDSFETQQLEQDKSWNILNKETDSNARKIAYDMMTTSSFETATVSKKTPLDYSERKPPSEEFSSKQKSRSSTKNEEKTMASDSKGSYELVSQGDSQQKLDSVVQLDNKYSSFESSGVWTFPEEFRKICITNSGKSVMDFVEIQDTKRSRNQRSLDFTKIENTEKNTAYVGTGTEGSKYERIQKIEESKTNASDNSGDENSEGPFNQVIKGAIIIGFGLLVLLTRQRKKRVKEKSG